MAGEISDDFRVSFLKTRPSRFSCVFRTDQAIWPVMVRWLGILIGTRRSTVRTQRELALENLALRQQLAVWKARQPRPRLTAMDRIFFSEAACQERKRRWAYQRPLSPPRL